MNEGILMTSLKAAALATAVVVAGAAAPSAQVSASPLQIVTIEGAVSVDGRPVAPPTTPALLQSASVVRTEDGRAEVLLAGGALFLGENSSARVIKNNPYNFYSIEVITGSAVVRTVTLGSQVVCEDTVGLSPTGLFRIDVLPAGAPVDLHCRFRVFDGAASVQLRSVADVLTTGQTMSLNKHCGDMIPLNRFDLNDLDSLDRWSRR